ncbi:winged helix-turn-helix domain-containing protein [Roseomonas sp. F4]
METGSYHFDRFCLDLGRGTLRRQDGPELTLRPKAFALLRHLLDHPGLLQGREALLETLWPGLIVTDDSLTQCVSDIRRALGDRAAGVLRTVPRRGYVLTAEVRHQEAMPGPAPLPAPAPPPRSPFTARRATLQVPPFLAEAAGGATERLARALAAELTAELIRFEDLRIVTDAAPQDFRLHAEVFATHPGYRLAIRLEDAPSGAGLWADRLDLPDSGLPPATLLVRLASVLDMEIARASLRRARHRPPSALTARDHYLLGRDLHQRGTEAETLAARAHFIAAIAADPEHAVAHAWQAFTVMRFVTHGWGEGDHQAERAEALLLARQAVELAPDSPLCISALAFALALCERWDEAAEMARLALRAGRPADLGTRTSCAEVLSASGFPEEAAAAVREALALDQHGAPRSRAVLGRALLLAGQAEAALTELRWCAARLPDYAPCFRTLVVAAMEMGRPEEARAALRDVKRLQPNWVPGQRPVLWFLRRPADLARFTAAFAAAAG